MNLRPEQLENHLKNNLASIYLVSGDEPILVQESCAAIRQGAKESGFNECVSFQADKSFDWQNLLQAANTLSLFSEKSLLKLQLPTGKPGDKGGKALQAYVQNPPPDKLLLIITNKLDAATQKTKWYKAIAAAGVIVQIWPINMAKLPAWIGARMQQRGLTADKEGLQLLAEYTEGNLLSAVQEIEKLHLLYGECTLTLEQIITAVVDNARFSIFDLVDNTLQGEFTKSIRILTSLKNEKTEPTLILWALARELRTLITMAQQLEQGKSIETVMQRVWQQRKPYIKRALQQHKTRALQHMLRQCAAIDRTIKGAKPGNIWIELDKLCLRLAKS